MSQNQKQKQKELFEKLQEICKGKNDSELDAIIQAFGETFEPAGDEDGGNNPDVPDTP